MSFLFRFTQCVSYLSIVKHFVSMLMHLGWVVRLRSHRWPLDMIKLLIKDYSILCLASILNRSSFPVLFFPCRCRCLPTLLFGDQVEQNMAKPGPYQWKDKLQPTVGFLQVKHSCQREFKNPVKTFPWRGYKCGFLAFIERACCS